MRSLLVTVSRVCPRSRSAGTSGPLSTASSATRQASTARSGCRCWPTTTRPELVEAAERRHVGVEGSVEARRVFLASLSLSGDLSCAEFDEYRRHEPLKPWTAGGSGGGTKT